METLLKRCCYQVQLRISNKIAADDNYPKYIYGEDDGTPEYKELYDDEVDVNAEV